MESTCSSDVVIRLSSASTVPAIQITSGPVNNNRLKLQKLPRDSLSETGGYNIPCNYNRAGALFLSLKRISVKDDFLDSRFRRGFFTDGIGSRIRPLARK